MGTTGKPTNYAQVYRRIIQQVFLFAAVLGGLAVVMGYLVDGTNGLWGALIGAGVIAIFFTVSAVVMLKSQGQPPVTQIRNQVISFAIKIISLFGLIFVLGQATWMNPKIFAATILAGVIGSLMLEWRAIVGARVPPSGGV
ncbi:MAG: hypothetical protein FWD29_00435 [Micrococcales bacterium]|nr:hypothetical protein [Micrococcales bacterium]